MTGTPDDLGRQLIDAGTVDLANELAATISESIAVRGYEATAAMMQPYLDEGVPAGTLDERDGEQP